MNEVKHLRHAEKLQQLARSARVADQSTVVSQWRRSRQGERTFLTLKSLKHIFHGEVNTNGRAVGFHYEGAQMEAMYGTKVIEITRSMPDANSVYTAKVRVRGASKQAKSSFFPRTWNKAQVLQSVKEAYANRAPKSGKSAAYFEGTSKSGIKIGMYLALDGTIATAYPLYDQ